MTIRSILARTFFGLSLAVGAYATSIALAKPAHAGIEGNCPGSRCGVGQQLCCTHTDGADTFYYYWN